ncbi:unnamed protein product [Adineta ricciae]|uniref:Uncharacterized protein n=1 Tax=Adineta ricciae TaxID=249248 RepID=A0A816EYD2_ADIRI|nr:unnamed protein product [Adineta ricciae]CAF1655327.1 unnamed protein product [Adineta ricciae]
MPFDNSTAATCLSFRNVTSQCAQPDLNNCKRCITNVYHSHSNIDTICATCDTSNVYVNNIQREVEFLLDNRTQLDDRITIKCQGKGCNSVENINKIRQTSTITSDFDKLFEKHSNALPLNISTVFTIFFLSFQFIFIY